MEHCAGLEGDIYKLATLANSLSHPVKLAVKVGKNLAFHGVEIYIALSRGI